MSEPDSVSSAARWARALAVIGLAVGLGVGFLVGQSRPSTYDSTAQLLVGPIGADRSTLDAAGLLTRTYADLLTSRTAVERAAALVGVPAEDVTVSAIADDRSRTVLVVVESPDRTVPPALATILIGDLMVAVQGSETVGLGPVPGISDPGQLRLLDPPHDPAIERRSIQLLLLVGSSIIGGVGGWILGRLLGRAGGLLDEMAGPEPKGLPVVLARGGTAAGLTSEDAASRSLDADVDDLALVAVMLECAREGPFSSVLIASADQHTDAADVGRRFAAAGRRIGRRVVIAAADGRHGDVIHEGVAADDVIDVHGALDESGISRVRALTDGIPDGAVIMILAKADVDRPRLMAVASASDRVVLVTSAGGPRHRGFGSLVTHLRRVGARVVAVVEIERPLTPQPQSSPESAHQLATDVPASGEPAPSSKGGVSNGNNRPIAKAVKPNPGKRVAKSRQGSAQRLRDRSAAGD